MTKSLTHENISYNTSQKITSQCLMLILPCFSSIILEMGKINVLKQLIGKNLISKPFQMCVKFFEAVILLFLQKSSQTLL